MCCLKPNQIRGSSKECGEVQAKNKRKIGEESDYVMVMVGVRWDLTRMAGVWFEHVAWEMRLVTCETNIAVYEEGKKQRTVEWCAE